MFDLEFDLGPNKINDWIEENPASVGVSMVPFGWKLPVIGPAFLHLSPVSPPVASLANDRALGSFSRCSRQQEVFGVKKEEASVFKEG